MYWAFIFMILASFKDINSYEICRSFSRKIINVEVLSFISKKVLVFVMPLEKTPKYIYTKAVIMFQTDDRKK